MLNALVTFIWSNVDTLCTYREYLGHFTFFNRKGPAKSLFSERWQTPSGPEQPVAQTQNAALHTALRLALQAVTPQVAPVNP
mmetsp:Transcript_25883/g.71220  ORF Transcript_25883/g.71220 Transcript_25883/m.71220 type:complete len:82 (-) Transcript_25883:376-621(-)